MMTVKRRKDAKLQNNHYSIDHTAAKYANKNVEDVGAATDAAYNNMVKVLADSTSISETKLFSLSRPLSDSGAATDSVDKTIAPGKADSASLTDAGAVRMQSYSDITYFAEDYVGVTFTF